MASDPLGREQLKNFLMNSAPVETNGAMHRDQKHFDSCLDGACADINSPTKTRGPRR